jgi:hypothetical protein
VSLNYLNEAVASGDTERLIRYVRLHFGAGFRRGNNHHPELDLTQIDKEKMTLDVSGH